MKRNKRSTKRKIRKKVIMTNALKKGYVFFRETLLNSFVCFPFFVIFLFSLRPPLPKIFKENYQDIILIDFYKLKKEINSLLLY